MYVFCAARFLCGQRMDEPKGAVVVVVVAADVRVPVAGEGGAMRNRCTRAGVVQ